MAVFPNARMTIHQYHPLMAQLSCAARGTGAQAVDVHAVIHDLRRQGNRGDPTNTGG
jgi:hypothetical protein